MPKKMILLSAVWYVCIDRHTHISHQKKLPEFNFCTLIVYMHSIFQSQLTFIFLEIFTLKSFLLGMQLKSFCVFSWM